MREDRNIPKGWIVTTIGELVELAQGVAINAKTNYVLSDKDNGIPLLKINNLLNNTIDQYANPDLVPKQSIIHKNDVIFTRTGQVGEVLINKYGILHNNSFKVIPNDKLYYSYLYWYLKSNKVYNYVQKVAGGSVQKDLNHSAFKTIEFKYPEDLKEQKAIASILTSFDDKIELLQAQNETLETIAQTIFKEWFGKYQVGDELPEGWREGKIGDFNAIVTDYVANGSFASLKENVTLYYDIPEYALFIRNTDLKSNFANKVYVDRHSYDFLSKTKLFGGEIIISNVGDVGSVYLCPFLDIPMTLGNNVVMIKSKFNYYLFSLFKSNIGEHLISTITSGSAQQKFNKTEFRNLDIIVPSNKVLLEFENTAESLYNKISCNNSHIQTLQATRDTLLPKLMSGKVRVDEFKE